MKMLKKVWPLAAAVLLASCGGGNNSAASSEASLSKEDASSVEAKTQETPASSEGGVRTESPFIDTPVEIQFMSNSSYSEYIQSYADAFMEIEPNVTVTVTKETGSYQDIIDKVIQGIPANNYPDIVVAYPDAVEQILEVGKVLKLDNYIENQYYGWSDDDLTDIIETYLDEGRSYPRSGTFSLPFAKSTEAMFYNKDVIIGLDLSAVDPTINGGNPLDVNYIDSLTWEELFEKLVPAIVTYNEGLTDERKILKTSGDYADAVVGYHSGDNMFITLAEQYGYGYTSIDDMGTASLDFVNDGMKSLMKKFNGWKNQGYLTTSDLATTGFPNFCYTATSSLFTISSTGGLKYNVNSGFETGVAPIPQAAGSTSRKVINQGPSLAILNHSDDNRSLASWLFTKFMLNEANSLDWAANTGYLPIRYSVSSGKQYLDIINEGKKAASGTLDHLKAVSAEYVGRADYVGDALFASPVFKGSSTARTQVGGIVTSILNLSTEECTDAKVNDIFQTAYSNTLKAM